MPSTPDHSVLLEDRLHNFVLACERPGVGDRRPHRGLVSPHLQDHQWLARLERALGHP